MSTKHSRLGEVSGHPQLKLALKIMLPSITSPWTSTTLRSLQGHQQLEFTREASTTENYSAT